MKNKCIYCKNKNIRFIREIKSPYNKKTYELYFCTKCYLSFFIPLVFEDIYNKEGFYSQRHTNKINIFPWSEKIAEFLSDNKYNLSNKKILDIGASNCVNFLVLKKSLNLKAENYYALELDKKALEIGRSIGVKNIITYYFKKDILTKIKTKFDLILATEVLEHQTDPKEFLETAFKILKKEGRIIFTVPNKNRFFMKFRESPGDVPPHHFLKFGKDFFLKNFKEKIVYLEDFHKVSNIKRTTQSIYNIFFHDNKYWYLFILLMPLIRLIQLTGKIREDRLLIVLKNKV